MKIIFYETKKVQNLWPIVATRPASEIFCGGATLCDLVGRQFPKISPSFIVRPYLESLAYERHPRSARIGKIDDDVLFLNTAMVPDISLFVELARSFKGKSVRFVNGSQVIGAYLTKKDALAVSEKLEKLTFGTVERTIKSLDLLERKTDARLFEFGYQVVSENQQILSSNISILKKGLRESRRGVYVGKNVRVAQNVFFDTKHGQIILEENVVVKPFAYLKGPIYVGRDSVINEFSSIKEYTALGPVCKVGGEIEASVIQGYSNKQHYGGLFHSYVGRWVNMGAGTNTSNLKNTYGTVRVLGEDTGEQFFGAIIADYVKTAINTAIYTGKVIGPSAHIYGAVTSDVPGFASYVSVGSQYELPLPLAEKIQKAMAKRRDIPYNQTDEKLLLHLFNETATDRKNAKVKKGKLQF